MNQANSQSVIYHFESLEDPRIERSKRHLLLDIIVIRRKGARHVPGTK